MGRLRGIHRFPVRHHPGGAPEIGSRNLFSLIRGAVRIQIWIRCLGGRGSQSIFIAKAGLLRSDESWQNLRGQNPAHYTGETWAVFGRIKITAGNQPERYRQKSEAFAT